MHKDVEAASVYHARLSVYAGEVSIFYLHSSVYCVTLNAFACATIPDVVTAFEGIHCLLGLFLYSFFSIDFAFPHQQATASHLIFLNPCLLFSSLLALITWNARSLFDIHVNKYHERNMGCPSLFLL